MMRRRLMTPHHVDPSAPECRGQYQSFSPSRRPAPKVVRNNLFLYREISFCSCRRRPTRTENQDGMHRLLVDVAPPSPDCGRMDRG